MARTVPDLCLMLSAMVSDSNRDPLATTVPGHAVRRAADYQRPGVVDLSSLRVAATPDWGFAPTERHIAEVFAAKTARLAPAFAAMEQDTPDCSGSDEVFEVLRAVSFLASAHDRVATRRTWSAPTSPPMSRRGCVTARWTWPGR